MSTVAISVVIATFNRGQLIVPTIASALTQTHAAHEVIVVGDGCTDGTGDIVAANFGHRVLWRNLERNFRSQSFANNAGIRLASGTHIAYLGHDDIWSPRHLEALATTIGASDPDFAVSGAICHGPEGTDTYRVTGLFDDPAVARAEFFPPSSIAHRRAVVGRIGYWADPAYLRRPADCDFLLRGAEAGCSFASTKRITAHKFTAAQRYLSYRFPSAAEQERMLADLAEPDFEAALLASVLDRATRGAQVIRIEYPDYDQFARGSFHGRTRSAKGLDLDAPMLITEPTTLPVNDRPGSFDWRAREEHPMFGPIRWSDRNPNPRYFLNVRLLEPFTLRIHILAFADTSVADALRVKVNDVHADFTLEKDAAKTFWITIRPELALPVEDGLALVFETHRPGTPLPLNPIRTRRFALGNVTITPDPPAASG